MARLNENENENENESSGSSGLFSGGRFNTYKIAKQAFTMGEAGSTPDVVGRAPKVPEYTQMAGWDAENRVWIYLADFVALRSDWFEKLETVAKFPGWDIWNVPGNGKAPALDTALQDIVDAAGEREDRFAECFHQQDAEGCISYWMAMLRIDPSKQPNTYQLIRFGRKLGEMVIMCLKEKFNKARPSQICPAILPMFDPPRTSSYPAGHSLQSYLISYFLRRVMKDMPQSTPPTSWEAEHTGLFALARRVADNRVISGVHFDIDCKGGFLIAAEIDKWFDQDANKPGFSRLAELLRAAKAEFPQFN